MRALALLPLALNACGGATNIYQGMDADALYARAEQEYAAGDHDKAIRTLDRLLLAFGDWDRVPDARLFLSSVYFEQEDYLTARSEYQRFLERYSGHPRAPDAALGICRSLAAVSPKAARDPTYTEDALTFCRNATSDYAGTPQATEAREIAQEMRSTLAEKEFLNADFYFRRRLYDSAIKYYAFVTTLYGDTEFAPRAWLGLYRANEAIGYDDDAETARGRLLAQFPDSEEAAQVRTDGPGA